MWDGEGAAGWWSWIFLALLLGGVTLLAVVLLRVLAAPRPHADRRRGRAAPPPSRARQLLDDRYARGEIDAAEFESRRRRLQGQTGGEGE
jgi:putative membrane protein